MPILILNNPETPRGLVIDDRVLIGRRPFNTVMVPDPSVSRIHAWIGPRESVAPDNRPVLHDAGSRAGTLLNGQPLAAPAALADGDEITVGPVTLTYFDADELPADVEPLDQPAPPPASDPYDGGIYFDCACGGPMWVSAELAGASGRCRYCGERLVVPHQSGQLARPLQPADRDSARRIADKRAKAAAARKPPEIVSPTSRGVGGPRAAVAEAPAAPPARRTAAPPPEPARHPTCSICQTDILPSEANTRCPSCRLTFHEQCWQENYGCSAYGCDQVNVLAPGAPAVTADADHAAESEYEPTGNGEYAPEEAPTEPLTQHSARTQDPALRTQHSSLDLPLLAGAFVGMGLSVLAYGIPSMVMAVVAIAFLLAGRSQRKSLAVVALIVAILGSGAGWALSKFMYKGERVWETWLR